MSPAIHLHTFDSDMAVAWGKAFGSDHGIKIVEGDILTGTADAVVSPANSFGFMDGGIDLAYRNFFGMEIQHRVRSKIRSEHFGELPVGQAVVVETDHEKLPLLIVAPTMRVPDRIGDTVNVYLAFRAALLAAIRHNVSARKKIARMRAPALGTGVGGMPIHRAARQMHAAFASVFEESSWRDDPIQVLVHHENLRS
jgi:O-acetyl-ADP-ribose deacetylase (regulator of RNase III)